MLRLLVGVAVVAAAALIWTAPDGTGPRYTPEGELLLPEGVERWVAVGSSLGLGYSVAEAELGGESFHTVLLEPGAYDRYRHTGRFPDGTMLALVIRSPAARVAPSRTGRVAGELVGIEMAVKDTDALRGRLGLLRFRTAGPRRIGPSIPTGAMRPVSRGACRARQRFRAVLPRVTNPLNHHTRIPACRVYRCDGMLSGIKLHLIALHRSVPAGHRQRLSSEETPV